MKRSSAKWVGLTGCVIAGFAANTAIAAPIKITPPDAALVAAVDAQNTNVNELTVSGDFEAWFPNLYPDYKWARETVAVGTNGLFQLNYVVLDRHNRIQDELSVLLFRPGFQSGVQTGLQQRRHARHRPALRDERPSASSEVVRAIEEVLEGAQLFQASPSLYAIHGDAGSISLVSRFPGRDPGSQIQRVRIFLERTGRGTFDIVMEHRPHLWDIMRTSPERVVLAENASLFQLAYWNRASRTYERREHNERAAVHGERDGRHRENKSKMGNPAGTHVAHCGTAQCRRSCFPWRRRAGRSGPCRRSRKDQSATGPCWAREEPKARRRSA